MKNKIESWMMMENKGDEYNKAVVSIALATDKNYYAPTLVTIKSIVLHASKCHNYNIYILSEVSLDAFIKKCYLSLIKDSENIDIVFIPVGNRIGKVNLSKNGPTKGITQATYFRFLLPQLLLDVSKVLYIDADTVICDDIAHIYNEEIGDYYVAGVRDIAGYHDKEVRCQELSIDTLEQYINAGVLLMNLDEFRKNNLSEKMLGLAVERSFLYNDQDIINSVCFGKIKCIPFACNVIIDYLENSNEISKVLDMDYREEVKSPIVLHYAGRAKPWYSKKGQYAHFWWNIVDSFALHIKLLIKYGARKLKIKSWKT